MSLYRVAANFNRLNPACARVAVRAMSGDAGSGAGKGGGSGGSIRDAGGAFGKMEVAQEEMYFRKQNEKLLQGMKDDLASEIEFHEEQIKAHTEALAQKKARLGKLDG